MMILSGCGPTDQGNTIDLTNRFVGGTVGINTYFLEGLPPAVVHDNGQFPFSVAVVLENLGETDIVPGSTHGFLRVELEGINPNQWGAVANPTATSDGADDALLVQTLQTPLRGARKNFDGSILPGEITTLAFEGLNYMPNIRGNVDYTIRASICYDYQTLSTTLLCIKDDVLESIQDDSICSLTGEKFPQNTGGPVQVTSMIQLPLAENRVQVNFVIEHVGTGEFYGNMIGAESDGETCSPSVSNFNKHWVNVAIDPLSDSRLSINCPRLGGSDGNVKLYQGAPQTISCIITRDGESQGRIYQDLLEVVLNYRYGQFIETPILVQDVSNEPIGDIGPNP